MPTFELVLLYRQMDKLALKAALKRSAGLVFDLGATIRRLSHLGLRDLPYVIKRKGTRHYMAHYFIFDYDSGMEVPKPLRKRLLLDLDVLRATNLLKAYSPFLLHNPETEPECTLELDLKPPPYRETIIELQDIAKKRMKKKLTHKNYDNKEFLFF